MVVAVLTCILWSTLTLPVTQSTACLCPQLVITHTSARPVNSLWSHLSSLWDRLDPGRVQLTTQSLLSHNNSSFQDVFYYLTSGVGGLVERSGSEVELRILD